MFGNDSKLADKDEIEENLKNMKDAEGVDLESEKEVVNMANYIDNQISQALLTGRIESETRASEGKDPLLMAVAVTALSSISTALMIAYQFYL